ncbi:MAG TPA: chitinase [Pirellulales bacterium]
MRRTLFIWLALLIALTINFKAVTIARADWPAHVFAPYMYIGSGDSFKLTDCDDACGLKYYTLAFIIADKEGNSAWDGRTPMEKDLYHDQIDAIRKRGGDVIISFGGEAGKDLALVEKDVDKLEAKYQSVIDRYKFTWLDFDIEGKQLEDDAANQARNIVLAALQKKNPGLLISYTLPVDPNGISKHSLELLKDAKVKGVKVKSANVMTMYFGPTFTKNRSMIDLCTASAEKAYEQCQKIDPAIEIGITPMIGKGGTGGSELFSLDDAKKLTDWASPKPWVCSLSFWCINRDSGKPSKKNPDGGNTASGIPQQPFDYSKAMEKFTRK